MARKKREQHLKVKPGAAPGTINVDPSWPKPVIRILAYNADEFVEKSVSATSELEELLAAWSVVWVNVEGLGDAEMLKQLSQLFGLHRLALEDVVNLGQRAKVETYDEHLYVVLRMSLVDAPRSEQISLFLGEQYVLTFQERAGDCFDAVRKRVRDGKGLMRKVGPDYLAYALVDAVIDGYFPLFEAVGDRIERLEEEVFMKPHKNSILRIQAMKAELRDLRRITWPHRDVVSALLRDDTPYVADRTRVYLRDCADHAVQVTDQVEGYREAATDLMGAYLSSISNRMNEVMKVLTIVASIFIPLGFLAGVYGMNFSGEASPWNMPELGWYWGYPAVLGLMVLVGGGMVIYFWKKGWF